MFSVVINEKGGSPRVLEFDKPEVTIGRVQGNDIILPKGNISKRHSRIVLKDAKFIIVDLKSTNGTYVNGRKITSPHILKDNDKIYIGDFTLTIESGVGGAAEPPPPPPPPPRPVKPTAAKREPEASEGSFDELIAPVEDYGPSDEFAEEFADLRQDPAPLPAAVPAPPRIAVKKKPKRRPDLLGSGDGLRIQAAPRSVAQLTGMAAAQSKVFDNLTRRGPLDQLAQDAGAAEQAARSAINDVIADGQLPDGVDNEELVALLVAELTGLGPLDSLLEDTSVSQILANSPYSIFVEREGEVSQHNRGFSSPESMLHVINTLLTRGKVLVPESAAIVDTRLPDGTHVTALRPPVGAFGPVLTLLKPLQAVATLDKLAAAEVLTAAMAEFLQTCVLHRKNIVVSANFSTDGEALLRAIASTVDASERIVTVEEVAQLNLPQTNVVSLEASPNMPNGGVTLRDLVRTSLRMVPDRLIIGGCRGGEALEVLQAMSGVLDGSMALVHGYGARDCLSRLEAMTLMGGVDFTAKALRELIATAVDVVVQITRYADGIPRVSQIAVVSGMEVDLVTTQDIFSYRHEGFDKEGNAIGRFLATGVVPRFVEELQHRGERVNLGIFREEG